MNKEIKKIINNILSKYPVETWRFKYEFKARWLRIHSLPESKRYPNNKEEEGIIFCRHKTIIEDLLGTEFIIVINIYENETYYKINKKNILEGDFLKLKSVLLNKKYPLEFEDDDPECIISSYFNKYNAIKDNYKEYYRLFLKIINDEIRYFLISLESEILVAPYDGGIDIIFPTTKMRDEYKIKYSDWLSKREDGF